VAVFDHAYHGRTNLTMAMNFKRHPYGTNYGPLATSVTHAPMSYPMRDPEGMTGEQAALRAINYLEKRVGADQLACMVIEPIQGEGGFIIPAEGFLTTLGRWAKENGIIMVADEVQSGMARTGKWFAYEYEEGFQPDLVTVAKGIAGEQCVSEVVCLLGDSVNNLLVGVANCDDTDTASQINELVTVNIAHDCAVSTIYINRQQSTNTG
jgi:4-aminobutyrate aminotransferase/(S)-3-amino-2-methylpropionate transaminase